MVIKLLRTEHPTPEDVARLRHECTIASGLGADGFVRPPRVERFGRRAGLLNLVTQRLGGTLSVDSQPGRGTRFTIDVPLTTETDRA